MRFEAEAQETRFRPQPPVGRTGRCRKRVCRLMGAHPVGRSTVQATASLAWLNRFNKRDLLRAALFLWMIPFCAALSRELTASRAAASASSIWPAAISMRVLLT